MSEDNVTEINKDKSNLTLASVGAAINAWRQTRKRANEKMPDYLWDQVLILIQTEPEHDSKIFAALGVTRPQLDAEKQRREGQSLMSSSEKRAVTSLSASLQASRGMKRSATKLKMKKKDREGIDICASC